MTYVCSDIHAEYDLFIKLLDKINFSDNDVMYVCGDVIDKGNDSVKLMQFVMDSPNIFTIIGNHEYAFLKRYWALMENSPENFDTVLQALKEYFPHDGHLLDWDTIDYIEFLPFYVEEKDFILVHAGLPVDNANNLILPQAVRPEFLVYDRNFKEPNFSFNTEKCVFFGHTPTSYLCGEHKILRYKKTDRKGDVLKDYFKIHLDVGTWLVGKVGCLCIETLEEFYVEKD